MSKAPANQPPKPKLRQSRYVAGDPGRGCSGGMSETPANRSVNRKPRQPAHKRRRKLDWIKIAMGLLGGLGALMGGAGHLLQGLAALLH
jgi:hypothetical protein